LLALSAPEATVVFCTYGCCCPDPVMDAECCADLESMDSQGWLFGDIDRERLLDMDRRLEPVRRRALAVLAVALLISAPWLGFWTVIPLLVAGVLFKGADLKATRVSHPEYMLFGAWVGSEVIIALSIVIANGLKVGALAWLAIPIVTLPARFSGRVVMVGVAIALGLLVAVAGVTEFQMVLHAPPLVIMPAALIIAVAILSMALMRSDIEHRDECVIDPLTGMLNRKALETRTPELVQQSEVSGEPVGLIVGDVDHFKAINDSHGHAAGDAVLAEVAYRIRKQLRAFDLAYRLGGEEFVVLLPGADLRAAERLAEGLRAAVAVEAASTGQLITMSFGVGASERGAPFGYDDVFAAADAALYEAKHAGRDCVCVATPGERVQSPPVAV
jgi:diguanylate cyclase (GGDEF)-like protein